MDKNRIDGTGKKVSGSVKEAAGKVTGDSKLQAEGIAEKAAGPCRTPAAPRTACATH